MTRYRYDPPKETLLGNLDDKHKSEVYLWSTYGVVCPDSITTNGSVRYLLHYRTLASLTGEGAAWFVGYAMWRWVVELPALLARGEA